MYLYPHIFLFESNWKRIRAYLYLLHGTQFRAVTERYVNVVKSNVMASGTVRLYFDKTRNMGIATEATLLQFIVP